MQHAQFEGYHAFQNEDGEDYGSFEVFYISKADDFQHGEPGWYWWAGFPGCLPDSEEPSGPFATSREAFDDAREV